ncbi:MAG: LPS-assembly protein LptD [Candidatus Omnitrophica bacterium]|nr:LPS-assembly protein LptD [Candidatus Omnitrophota bacterium]
MKYFQILLGVLMISCAAVSFAQENIVPVEINGDEVQYSVTGNKVSAIGHVVVKRLGVTLSSDRMEFDRTQNVGIAQGHVVLERDGARLTGDKMIYNFATMKGEFIDAKITSKPFYGSGKEISKEDDKHIVLKDGYITTCDLDHPHFKLRAPRVDIYQGDKAVARNMTVVLGKVPIFYLPRYTQDLRHQKPMFTITPGYYKGWGSFALSQWRHYWNDRVNTVVHVDYRSKRGFGEGADLNYQNERFGNGFMKAYYTQERLSDEKFFFDFNSSNNKAVIERERYKGEWRHKWDIDDHTKAVWQYYKLSDAEFVKDFFPREYEEDVNPATYFLLSKGFETAGTLSLRSDVRVNRFNAAVNRLPEINYLLPGNKILDSGFYWKSNTTFSNLAKLEASPSAHRYETMRFDADNEISYPFKVKFIELRPFVGGQETFYSKTLEKTDNNTLRGVFKTGADVSTRFFRVYDAQTNWLNLDIHRLRHVVTPSVAYFYTHDPSLESSKLVQFDGIDSVVRGHGITFGLENKLQTKRSNKSEDLLRFLVSSDFYLKEDSHKGGFNNVTTKTDFIPNRWMTLYAESTYDTIEEHLSVANFDVYFHDPQQSRWSMGFGKRYDRAVDDQITSQLNYRINQKWYGEVYQRWDVDRGINKEQQYAIVRDLHEWEGRISFNHKDNDGDAVWVIFTLKEFPDLAINFGTGFNRSKAGANR